MKKFNAEDEVKRMRTLRIQRHKRRYNGSRLDRYKHELLSMRLIGSTPTELQLWLRTEKRTKVALSTVTRWLQKND